MSTLASLRSEALAAREAGDTHRAVSAWRALLDAAPDDWTLALELKSDLKAGLHYPDSCPRFRRAARTLPDAAWLSHYAALYAFHGSDLEAIDARARALRAAHPGDARIEAILGDVARQRRDWAEAERAFAAVLALDPSETEAAFKLADARTYRALAQAGWTEAGARYPIHVVNLDRNPERMVEIDRQYAGSAPVRRRIAGIEGSRLPPAAVQRLTGDADAPRGTLGCFLSHAAAWQALLDGPAAAALVIEDDTIPLLDLPATLGALPLPATWDVVFVNDRLSPRGPAPAQLACTAMPDAMAAFHPEDNAPGGDGYLISRAGAAKLLAWTARDGFAHDVDWRIIAYALSPTAIAGISGHARSELSRLSAGIGGTERLDGFVLSPPLIRTVGVSSDREDVNRGE